MTRIASVLVLITASEGVLIAFGDELEVSLDCPGCQRMRRTVIFRVGEESGRCTPTGHPFLGRITGKRCGQDDRSFEVVYEVAYEYEPFIDRKYPVKLPYYGPSRGEPTWGRVHFVVTCPDCSLPNKASIQTNLVRPWSKHCKCGRLLYTEDVEQPELRWRDG